MRHELFLSVRQFLQFFLDQADDLRILLHLGVESEGGVNVRIKGKNFLLHAITLNKKIRSLDANGFTNVLFNAIEMPRAQENFAQVRNNGGFDFLSPEPFEFASDWIANSHLVTVIPMGPVFSVGSLADEGHSAIPAADNTRQEEETSFALCEAVAFPSPVLNKQFLGCKKVLFFNDGRPRSLYDLVSLPRLQTILLFIFFVFIHLSLSSVGVIRY